ncbi:MAG: acyltransferase, partial [Clostridia bacterium]|nr:acyltransferase [Clostridia bacterium]
MRRELWLDYLRAFACILVTLGHLLMSLEDADVIKNVAFSSAFVSFIYCFHVYIFFFCSGYLFQKSHKGQLRWTDTLIPRLEKCINFLILYVVFSGITYVIKVAFSSDVNS